MTPEKENYYENATRKLLNAINGMGMDKTERMRAKNLALLFRDSFKLPDVKHATFSAQTNPAYFTYHSDGFCRASSVSFAMLMGGGTPDWQLMYIDTLWTYGPHHYLMHMPTRTILDLTHDQYTHSGIQIPYELGQNIPLHLEPNDPAIRFTNAIGIDMISHIKKQKD